MMTSDLLTFGLDRRSAQSSLAIDGCCAPGMVAHPRASQQLGARSVCDLALCIDQVSVAVPIADIRWARAGPGRLRATVRNSTPSLRNSRGQSGKHQSLRLRLPLSGSSVHSHFPYWTLVGIVWFCGFVVLLMRWISGWKSASRMERPAQNR